MEASNSKLEIILSNPGLQYIAENIIKHLDIKSVAKCREVSSSFLDLIDGQKFWYIEQIKKFHNARGNRYSRDHQFIDLDTCSSEEFEQYFGFSVD